MLLLLPCLALQVSQNLTIYPLIPPEAEQGWKLELFCLEETIAAHHHRVQRQIIVVVDGQLEAYYGSDEAVTLSAGMVATVDPGIVHSLIPEGKVQFFSFDIPGFVYPDDVYQGPAPGALKWTRPKQDALPTLSEPYFRDPFVKGEFVVYDIVKGLEVENKWSVALIEINDTPRHYHKIEKEIFCVVQGVLDIEVDGVHQIIKSGEYIEIFPGCVHQLKSAGKEPVRVLCFSFPAFDPSDMYSIDLLI